MKNWNYLLLFIFAFVLCGTAEIIAQTETMTETGLENQLTMDMLQALNENTAEVFVHDGKVTFLNGTSTTGPISSWDDAGAAVTSMVELLGGDIRTQLLPWRVLTDANGNNYYVFQQMYAGTTVLGGAVKVITDADGNMTALTSSIVTELPDVEESVGIDAEAAEQIVLNYAAENNQPEWKLIEGSTDLMILPLTISIDTEEEDDEGSRFVWVVYTDNPASRMNSTADLPYLAHYVTLDGVYLYSLPTIMPGDEASVSGFDAAYVFEFMEPVDYTGYVDLYDGSEMELTVTVMRDKRTGMYYLGNIERKIVVADCWNFLYNDGRVVLAASPDNLEWDQAGLLSLYHYCKAYDYYKEIGWIGGDGKGTPILILNDLCDEKHNRIDNAAFIGNYLGWSLFGASVSNTFSQALDVIAHEYTHCVTDAVMTYNSYMNDFGAINEAISDIQGNICDLMDSGEEDLVWLLGEDAGEPIRSMGEPHIFDQPEYSWDLYYKPSVEIPTAINDEGGVHTNSSLLNNIAYRLVTDGGMSLEEARAFWFAVDCAIVPGTDYKQLAELLPWILKSQGMEQYQDSLQQAIDATRLGVTDMPESFDDDRALVVLTLPDNENFTDGNWGMQIISIDFPGLKAKISEIFTKIVNDDIADFPSVLRKMFEPEEEEIAEEPEEEEHGFFAELFRILDEMKENEELARKRYMGEEPPVQEEVPEENDTLSEAEYYELLAWARKEFADVFYSNLGAAGQDGRTIRMMSRPGRTIPILMHMTFSGLSVEPDQVMVGIFTNGKWYVPDLMALAEQAEDGDLANDQAAEIARDAAIEEFMNSFMESLSNVKNMDDFWDILTLRITGGEILEIPSTGLEDVVLPEPSEPAEEDDAPVELPEPGSKSRPKL